jgi:hypothetical protein
MTHVAPCLPPIPCLRESHGHCAICERIDRDGPNYSEPYRRLFHPEEFPEEPPVVVSAPPPQPAVPCQDAGPAPVWPLAGDLLEAAIKRFGGDRLAKYVEAKTGKPCECEARRLALNALDAKLRKYLGW